MLPIQDPIDSTNLRGTIVGGTLEVFLADASGTEIQSPPELIIGLWPTAVTPVGYTTAAWKEQEDFIWFRQLMDPLYQHVAAGSTRQWKAHVDFRTKRKVYQRGMRLGMGILNHDTATSFGAAAGVGWMGDLYLILDM